MKRTIKQVLGIVLSVLLLVSVLPLGVLGAVETDAGKILSDAYALAEGESLDYEATLTGKITFVKTPYDSYWQNLSVIIEIYGYEGMPILCYRLKGDGADSLAIGDSITVTGIITNYYGTIEFAAGCILDEIVSGGGPAFEIPEDPRQIVDDAYALEPGAILPYEATLTGLITDVLDPYSVEYHNITVAIVIEGREDKPIVCFRMKGDDAETLKVGDIITVSGTMINYSKTDAATGVTTNTIELSPCSLANVGSSSGGSTEPLPTAVTVYCETDWEKCYVYATDWTHSPLTGAWPGTRMSKGDNGVWFGELPPGTMNVSFNNGGGGYQSGELEAPAGSSVKFVTDTGSWELPAEDDGIISGTKLTTPLEIVDAAYALEDGEALPEACTLTGKIISVDTPWHEQYENITVSMIVEDRVIQCFRLKGESAEALAVDDIITVTGILTNYGGTVEFAAGCTLDYVTDMQYLISEDRLEFLSYEASANRVYINFVATSDGTAMLTLSEVDPDFDVVVYQDRRWHANFTGTEAPASKAFPIKEGSLYMVGLSTVRFQNDSLTAFLNTAGSLTYRLTSDVPVTDVTQWPPEDPVQIVDEAYALEEGMALPYKAILTGQIVSVDSSWSEDFYNITVTMLVEGRPIQCYRLTGEGTEALVVGDTITVSGTLANYYGTVEFQQGCVLVDQVPNDDWGPDSLALTGSGIPGLSEWDPSDPAGDMTEVADNVYEITVECPTATFIEFKFTGNDVWDAPWTLGSDDFEVGQLCQLSGYGMNMQLTVNGPCTLRFTVDLNGMRNGGNATVLVEKFGEPVITRKLTVIAPDSWTNVNLYTWEPEEFGTFPGAVVQKNGDVYQTTVKNTMTNLVISTQTWEGYYMQTDNVTLVPNGLDVTVTVYEDGSHWVQYGEIEEDVFRVVGNTSWMGNWDPASDAGLMEQIAPGVYQKCFKDVAPGSYEFKVTKNGLWDWSWGDNGNNFCFAVSKTCDVTVTFTYLNGEGLIEVDYAETVMGDVSGDGKLNMGDVAKLYAHVRNTNPITDEAALAVADFNGDGRINVGDTARIYAYLRGVDPTAIVDGAYGLEAGEEMLNDSTLTGTVVEIFEPYNSNYGCVTVSMVVSDRETMPITCTRLMGADAANITENDRITVTGRLRNFYGSIEFKEGCQLVEWEDVPTYEEVQAAIVDAAYGLGTNEAMDHTETLTGQVVSIEQAYTGSLPYISLTMAVAGREDKPISCYRLMGEEIDLVCLGDTVTVTGLLRNFYGTVEFDAGCQLDWWEPGTPEFKVETDPLKIVDLAYSLGENEEMAYDVTLTGKVCQIEEVYSAEYDNITVVIQVSGRESKPIMCYRLKGDGVANVAKGDTITVVGRMKNFYGDVEMVNCTMTKRVSGGSAPVVQTDYKKIVDDAYALAENASLGYEATLEGRITALNSPFDAQYQNMTVTIVVVGRESKPIECYRMKGDGIGNHLCVGDTIKVTGKIKNYNGTVEFDAGCQMTERKAGSTSKPTDPKQIVDAAFALGENAVLPYFATLTGTVKSIDEPYTDQYKNVTLTMTVQGTNGAKDIQCYRLKGDAAASVTVGNTITVTGAIKRFVRDKDGVREDKVEFDAGCILERLQR